MLLALLLAQAGPLVSPGAAPALPGASQPMERPAPRASTGGAPASAPQVNAAQDRLSLCLEDIPGGAQAAADAAEEWLASAKGTERAEAGQCLGEALAALERWDEAGEAFLVARTAADPADRSRRARLAAMAGNTALARGDAQAALLSLDLARTDASKDLPLLADVAIDRARALVELNREAEAALALQEAREAAPTSPLAWLLSATLSRRTGKLGEAQAQIERAFDLRPIDPEIGLEAGVIAVLSGREAAARKSWESVIAAAPQSPQAQTARGYLAQLAPAAGGTEAGR